MSGFFDRYNTDKGLEEEGVWVDYGEGLQVKIRRLNSKASRDCRRKLEKPYAAQFRQREMPDSLQEKLLNQQVAKAIVVDWKGVPNPDKPDQMLDCTEENILKVIEDERFKDFRDDILTASMERTTFEKEQRKVAEKNSQSVSSGS